VQSARVAVDREKQGGPQMTQMSQMRSDDCLFRPPDPFDEQVAFASHLRHLRHLRTASLFSVFQNSQ
jgi:hypothetical protein